MASSLLRVVSPPTFLNRLSHAGPFSIAVAAREGGVVLLAPDRRQVGRLTTDGSHYSDRYIDLRRRLGRHLETPDFKVHDGGRMLVEELIAGSAFRDLPMHLQLSVTRKLIRSYASLVKNLGEDSAARLSGAVLDLVEQADLPASLRKHLLDAKLLERSMRWPLVPSHTDLFPNNIVIVRRSPVLIDLSRVEMMPFWYDPLSLVCSRYHGEYVRAGFLRGWLDGELEELCRAAGLAPTNLNRTRDALLVAYCVTRAYVRASMTDFDLAVFEYWARALWQGVETSRRRLQN